MILFWEEKRPACQNNRNKPFEIFEILPVSKTLYVQDDKAAPAISFLGTENESNLTIFSGSSVADEDCKGPVAWDRTAVISR